MTENESILKSAQDVVTQLFEKEDAPFSEMMHDLMQRFPDNKYDRYVIALAAMAFRQYEHDQLAAMIRDEMALVPQEGEMMH